MNTTMAGRLCAADLGSGCGWTSVGLGLCEVNAPRLFVCSDLVLAVCSCALIKGTTVDVLVWLFSSLLFCLKGVQRCLFLFICSIILDLVRKLKKKYHQR